MAGSLALVLYWDVIPSVLPCIQRPSSCHTRQYRNQSVNHALDGAAVELFEDLRTLDKSFQSPEGE